MTNLGVKKYVDMFGSAPPPIVQLFEMDEELGGHFADIRELAFRQRPDGNLPATKELMCIVANVAIGNRDGAMHHARNARRAGVSGAQLREALYITFLILGAWGWSNGGYQAWQAWAEEE
jgi:alkylhydroperoxidase/carboxymuconolactone decarboxylase family protein YurZ